MERKSPFNFYRALKYENILQEFPVIIMKSRIWSYNLKKGGGAVREIEVIIDTEEIAEFFFQELLKRGYVPSELEVEELADITFEYLLEKSIIDEEMEED